MLVIMPASVAACAPADVSRSSSARARKAQFNATPELGLEPTPLADPAVLPFNGPPAKDCGSARLRRRTPPRIAEPQGVAGGWAYAERCRADGGVNAHALGGRLRAKLAPAL